MQGDTEPKVYDPQIELLSLLQSRGAELCSLSGRMFEAQFNMDRRDIYTRIVIDVECQLADLHAAVARFKERTADRSPSPAEVQDAG